MKATPKPKKWMLVRFEDFVLQQQQVLANLQSFLGFELGRIIVRADSVGRWKTEDGSEGEFMFDFFVDAMEENGYEAE
jgi:hypothetical protein